ncbi:RNA polymerase sporulation sigma factor SigF [Clostridium sp. 'deep sea']|uniref:RNA polymerase sporulation sigma factor SigF n=1 Tax=Clostridium sp. 'deep sea' TaxID=2779445 RepID=UPI001896475A|nr:RNA polymerase sporulation sigma factor SigF [Clostridium sp. 'deep sea']QOR35824.1 RNA polymerase sporulation sigma factor SigF [Clostridium sp. 'deep sea']
MNYNSPTDSSEYALLSDSEVKFLLAESHKGDKNARDRLVKCNLKLVHSIVNRFSNRGYELEDLFQFGVIGLVKAIDKFDLSYDVKFSTYAVPLIIGEIKRFLRDDSIIKVSRSLKRTAYLAKRTREKLRNKLGREIKISEIAKEIDICEEDIIIALDAVKEVGSLYEEVYRDDSHALTVLDQLKDDKTSEQEWVDKLNLKEALEKLNSRERLIIFLRYFQDKTQAEIAAVIGVSQVQVSRLEKKTLQKIKSFMG